jgi:hypothetical protein
VPITFASVAAVAAAAAQSVTRETQARNISVRVLQHDCDARAE